MLINPDKHTDFKRFLFDLYDEIEFFTRHIKTFHKTLDEYKWAIALNYLLLKILGDNPLSRFLRSEFGDEFENYKLICLFELKKNLKSRLRGLSDNQIRKALSYFNNFNMNQHVFVENLYEMRTNLDMKMLFSLFGGQSVSKPLFNKDGTEAIYFERADFREGSTVAEEKIKFLKNHIQKSNDSEVHCITLNRGYHWTPVRSLDNLSIRYLSPSYRYYLFKYNPNRAFILKPGIFEFLQASIKDEQKFNVSD